MKRAAPEAESMNNITSKNHTHEHSNSHGGSLLRPYQACMYQSIGESPPLQYSDNNNNKIPKAPQVPITNTQVRGIFGRMHRGYTTQQRIQMAEESIKEGGHVVSKRYNVPAGTIRTWRRSLLNNGGIDRLKGMISRGKGCRNQRKYVNDRSATIYTTTDKMLFRAQTNNEIINVKCEEDKGKDEYILQDEVLDNPFRVANNTIDITQAEVVNVSNTQQSPINNTQVKKSRTTSKKARKKLKTNIESNNSYILDPNIEINSSIQYTNPNNQEEYTTPDIRVKIENFIKCQDKYDMKRYGSSFFISELKIEAKYGEDELSSLTFNKQNIREMSSNSNRGSKGIEEYSARIYIGISSEGRILEPLILIEYPEGDIYVNRDIYNTSYIYETKSPKKEFESLCLQWFKNFTSTSGESLIIHSLDIDSDFQLPGEESLTLPRTHYLDIPGCILYRIFPFTLFLLPILQTNIHKIFYAPNHIITQHENRGRGDRLLQSILGGIRELPKQLILACFQYFFAQIDNLHISKNYIRFGDSHPDMLNTHIQFKRGKSNINNGNRRYIENEENMGASKLTETLCEEGENGLFNIGERKDLETNSINGNWGQKFENIGSVEGGNTHYEENNILIGVLENKSTQHNDEGNI